MVHLHFDTLIYQKHKLDRVRWFDESYALFLDGTAEKVLSGYVVRRAVIPI